MNRPTRVPSPPADNIQTAMMHADATFEEVERPNNVPATRLHQADKPAQAIAEHSEPEQPALPTTGFDKLATAIAAVMAEIEPVEKEGKNDFHNYKYARMQDLSRELTPLMGKHGIVVFQTEDGREMFDDGRAVAVRYRFTIVHKSGQIWPERPIQTGLSMCRTSNGKFDDKTLNKCHTSARKYFLLSLFQVPTADEDDADTSPEGTGQRPQRRPVPSPSGKLPPHAILIIDGEQPDAWAERFNGFIKKAESKPEIDQWYSLNEGTFAKIKGRFPAVYNNIVDHMDAREAELSGAKPPKQDPISSGVDFPGDKPMPRRDDSIPPALDRKLTPSETKWLAELDKEYGECSTSKELISVQESSMLPSKASASAYAYARAVEITKQHVLRVQNG